MRVRVYTSWNYDLPGGIDLIDLLAMLLNPGIAERLFGGANGDNLSADGENCGVFDDTEFIELRPATRARGAF